MQVQYNRNVGMRTAMKNVLSPISENNTRRNDPHRQEQTTGRQARQLTQIVSPSKSRAWSAFFCARQNRASIMHDRTDAKPASNSCVLSTRADGVGCPLPIQTPSLQLPRPLRCQRASRTKATAAAAAAPQCKTGRTLSSTFTGKGRPHLSACLPQRRQPSGVRGCFAWCGAASDACLLGRSSAEHLPNADPRRPAARRRCPAGHHAMCVMALRRPRACAGSQHRKGPRRHASERRGARPSREAAPSAGARSSAVSHQRLRSPRAQYRPRRRMPGSSRPAKRGVVLRSSEGHPGGPAPCPPVVLRVLSAHFRACQVRRACPGLPADRGLRRTPTGKCWCWGALGEQGRLARAAGAPRHGWMEGWPGLPGCAWALLGAGGAEPGRSAARAQGESACSVVLTWRARGCAAWRQCD